MVWPFLVLSEHKTHTHTLRNVNGIRNPFSYQPWNTARTFPAMFDLLGSDIVVMQELKIQRKDLRDDMVLLDGWDCYFSLPKHKKGYSGVGIFTRNATCAPIRAEEGLLGVLPSATGVAYRDLPADDSIGGYPSERQIMDIGVDPAVLDAEGRCVVVEFPAFVLLGVYSPANSNGLRDDFRYGFICALDCRIRNLIREGKNVVLVGDLNVSRCEIDTASAFEDLRKEGLTHEDYISTPNRRVFNHLLIGGEVVGERDEGREEGVLWDTTREFHPHRKGMYTHWEQKINARPGNFGSRIDFVLVSAKMKSWIKDANIQEGLLGSDHCPVYADFADVVGKDGEERHLLDIMNPPGVFEQGQRRKEWKVSSVPPFSARRMPEFDKRRSIKAMFAAPALKKASTSDMAESKADPPVASSPSKREPPATQLSPEKPVSITDGPVKSPPPKRRPSLHQEVVPSNKRQKSNSQMPPAKGQQSLKGFFSTKPKATATASEEEPPPAAPKSENEQTTDPSAENEPHAETSHDPDIDPPSDAETAATKPGATSPISSRSLARTPPPAETSTLPNESPLSISSQQSPSQFGQRLETSARWGALFSRPIAPLCEGHNEPCKTMLTKKKGTNQGRSFWMCARPLGPSGQKEKNTEWRCGTFIWATDWKGAGGARAE